MKRARVVHVTAMGESYSLSPDAWRKVVEGVAKTGGYDLGQAKRLCRKLSEWDKQHFIDRWCDEDWSDELERLQEEK